MAMWLLLIGAGFLAGAMNAVAGGGSFVGFPALVFAGVPAVNANASSTVALFPGAVTSSWAFRHLLASVGEVSLRAMLISSLAGGLTGAALLLATPQRTFDLVIPWLLLLATVMFAFGSRIGAALRRTVHIGPVTVLGSQYALSIYGGYFGGAVGIMMMAVWSLLGSADVRQMNPAKVLLVGATNSVAVLYFVVAGAVWWPQTLAMLFAAALGGYAGARIAMVLRPRDIRRIVMLVSVVTTAGFFLRAY
jgi:uncharacterized membrane protein YfcA